MTSSRSFPSSPFALTFYLYLILSTFLTFQIIPSSALALDQIIRPYQSVRSAGLGGVRLTTGLYDENFFNNPARITANPESKFTLLQLTPLEYTSQTGSVISSLSKGGDFNSIATQTIGKNIHGRLQLVLPAYYVASKEERKWALAIGVITGVQADLALRQSYQTSDTILADVGLAISFGYKLLEDALSLGVTTHLAYRMGAQPDFGLLDYIRGSSLSLKNIAGSGSMFDFDLGATYRITTFSEFELNAAFAIQNLLGGTYKNLPFDPIGLGGAAPIQRRSYGIGFSLHRATWGIFNETYLALEATDLLNNMNGSAFRLLHIGGETHWKFIALRLGLNQGYWTAGLGLDASFFTLDLASYGEEMGLNAGTLEDRRYTVNFGFHL